MKRHDGCKCGRLLKWDINETLVTCKYCGTEYKVDCNNVQVFWLIEKIKNKTPHVTINRMCKCDEDLLGDTLKKLLKCRYCGTEYKVDSDYIWVYWLVEKIKNKTPHVTPMR